MARTPNINLPEIEHGEVNGDATHNEGLWITDLHGQAIVEALQANEPSSPSEGQAWIINGPPTGTNWGADALENQVAHYYSGVWHYYTPIEGWRFYSRADGFIFIFDGLDWTSFSSPGCYLGGTTSTFTLNSTDSKLVNYSVSDEWNWEDEDYINPTAGEITIPLTGYYRCTAHILGTQGNSTKEEYILLKLDVVGGPDPGRFDIAFVDVTTDKTSIRNPSATFTRLFTAGEVLSLYMWASSSLGTWNTTSSTFEIDFTSSG